MQRRADAESAQSHVLACVWCVDCPFLPAAFPRKTIHVHRNGTYRSGTTASDRISHGRARRLPSRSSGALSMNVRRSPHMGPARRFDPTIQGHGETRVHGTLALRLPLSLSLSLSLSLCASLTISSFHRQDWCTSPIETTSRRSSASKTPSALTVPNRRILP